MEITTLIFIVIIIVVFMSALSLPLLLVIWGYVEWRANIMAEPTQASEFASVSENKNLASLQRTYNKLISSLYKIETAAKKEGIRKRADGRYDERYAGGRKANYELQEFRNEIHNVSAQLSNLRGNVLGRLHNYVFRLSGRYALKERR